MDGTLIDSGDIISNSINYVRQKQGLEVIDKLTILNKVNDPHINPAHYFYETEQFTDRQSKYFEEYYTKNYANQIKLYDGITNLLESLKDHYSFSIATNAATKYGVMMVEHLNIAHYFDEVIGADKVTQGKPNPEMILKLMQTQNYKKESTLLIGDSQKDIMAAKSADLEYIVVNWGFSNHDNALTDVNELLKLLISTKELE
ncbi:MAG: HAD-IA family hydrolase [Helicobacteraceae bacterium]|nr:HAD-IA family hydrolase [Helicobacteraceae bacterium]